jgi:hypothetical protein
MTRSFIDVANLPFNVEKFEGKAVTVQEFNKKSRVVLVHSTGVSSSLLADDSIDALMHIALKLAQCSTDTLIHGLLYNNSYMVYLVEEDGVCLSVVETFKFCKQHDIEYNVLETYTYTFSEDRLKKFNRDLIVRNAESFKFVDVKHNLSYYMNM